MPKLENLPRKILPIIYVLDTSNSMQGDKIASVNNAMEDSIQFLKKLSESNTEGEIRISVLTFSSGTKWITNGLVPLDEFVYDPIEINNNNLCEDTDLGETIKELNKRMSRKDLLSVDNGVGFYLPLLIFMTDGQPTDYWEEEINKALAENKWFKASTKIGIAIGDDADIEVLKKVVCNIETIFNTQNFINVIKFILRDFSMPISKKSNIISPSTTSDIVKNTMNEEKVEQDDNNTNQPDPQPDSDPGFDDEINADDWLYN